MKIWMVKINDDAEGISVSARTFVEAGKIALKYAKEEISESSEIEQITLLTETIN